MVPYHRAWYSGLCHGDKGRQYLLSRVGCLEKNFLSFGVLNRLSQYNHEKPAFSLVILQRIWVPNGAYLATCDGKGGWSILRMRKWQYENEVVCEGIDDKGFDGSHTLTSSCFGLKWKMPLGLGPQLQCIQKLHEDMGLYPWLGSSHMLIFFKKFHWSYINGVTI